MKYMLSLKFDSSPTSALVENNLAGVAVVDMRDRDGQSTLPMVRYVRESYPSVPVLLYFAISPDTSRDVLAFALLAFALWVRLDGRAWRGALFVPIGLLVFKSANPAAIWTIFICSIWPMIINTAVGVRAVLAENLLASLLGLEVA